MKSLSIVALITVACFTGLLTTGCWSDLDQYADFPCENLGGDFDNDGSCSRNDCNDWDPNIYPGAPCDDGDSTTINDVWTRGCECLGL